MTCLTEAVEEPSGRSSREGGEIGSMAFITEYEKASS